MSRAFVNEDATSIPEPEYRLPDPDSPYYPEAAAWALIQGADAGNTKSAELATGMRWGEPSLISEVEAILTQAVEEENLRLEQLARRYLSAAKKRAGA